MYALLVRFLVFIATFWLIQKIIRFFSRVNVKQPGSPHRDMGAPITKDTVKDPICGMYMDPRLAIHLEKGNESFYFCSEECQKKFLSAPQS